VLENGLSHQHKDVETPWCLQLNFDHAINDVANCREARKIC